MSLLKLLFGKEPVVGSPKSDEPDWDESIHSEIHDPDNDFTGGVIVTMKEWMLTHDRGMGVPEDRPSAWKSFDILPLIIPVVVLVALIVIGFIVVVLSHI